MRESLQTGIAAADTVRLEFEQLAEHPYSRVPTRYYWMMDVAGRHVGNINLRLQSTEHVVRFAGHIGYDVQPEHRGHGYAAQAVRLMIPIAREHGIDPLWITCDPANTASRRTLERAGAAYVETVPILFRNVIFPAGNPCRCRYRLWTAEQSKAQEVPSELT